MKAIIIDGSFISSKPDPNDIDLIVALEKGHDFEMELRPMDYNVLSRKRVRRRYGFDVFVEAENSERYLERVEFFQQVKDSDDSTKGLFEDIAMLKSEKQLQRALHWIDVFKSSLESLKKEVLPQSRQWHKLMAEGPEEEIKRLQADVDDYLARKERAKPTVRANTRQRKRS